MRSLHIRWPKYWSLSTSPSSAYSGLISFRIDCCRGCEQKDDLLVWNLWKSLINIILQGNYSLAIQWLGLHPFTTKIPQATWHGQKEKKIVFQLLYTLFAFSWFSGSFYENFSPSCLCSVTYRWFSGPRTWFVRQSPILFISQVWRITGLEDTIEGQCSFGVSVQDRGHGKHWVKYWLEKDTRRSSSC